jgi:SAM-dependent methyltransferase
MGPRFASIIMNSTPKRNGHDHAELANALYHGMLGRAPDAAGLRNLIENLASGNPIESVINSMIDSSEFNMRMMNRIIPPHALPNLLGMFPERYIHQTTLDGAPIHIFTAHTDDDFNLMEDLILRYRYYDVPGVWGMKIDLDKKITAALVRGLGASSCLELGCFTGAVISQLEVDNVQVVGLETSHLAFVLAYPNIRSKMIFADLLSFEPNRKFDVVLAMDILEHLNPVKFERYIDAIHAAVAENGYVYLNSPMMGADDVFGETCGVYLQEWKEVADASYWRHLDCDDLGWPKHGHLVWASPAWWEGAFRAKGLVRDREIEFAIHRKLGKFFEDNPGRKSLFVLKRLENARSATAVIEQINVEFEGIAELS